MAAFLPILQSLLQTGSMVGGAAETAAGNPVAGAALTTTGMQMPNLMPHPAAPPAAPPHPAGAGVQMPPITLAPPPTPASSASPSMQKLIELMGKMRGGPSQPVF